MGITLILTVIVLVLVPWPRYLVRIRRPHVKLHVLLDMLIIGFALLFVLMENGAITKFAEIPVRQALLQTSLTYALAHAMMKHITKMEYVFPAVQLTMRILIPIFAQVSVHLIVMLIQQHTPVLIYALLTHTEIPLLFVKQIVHLSGLITFQEHVLLCVQMEHGDLTILVCKFVHQGFMGMKLIEIAMILLTSLILSYSQIILLKLGWQNARLNLFCLAIPNLMNAWSNVQMQPNILIQIVVNVRPNAQTTPTTKIQQQKIVYYTAPKIIMVILKMVNVKSTVHLDFLIMNLLVSVL